jgi:hypothetical protein
MYVFINKVVKGKIARVYISFPFFYRNFSVNSVTYFICSSNSNYFSLFAKNMYGPISRIFGI